MDLSDIVELINLVSSRDISELEVEREGLRVRIVKGATARREPEVDAVPEPSARVEVERIGSAAGAAAATRSPEDDAGLYVMRAPIVGTFYRSPSPTAEPYVKPGDRVKKGQVLCIVEAMKLMNEIESEVSGVVAGILVEDGQAIEYGEPLFKVVPDK